MSEPPTPPSPTPRSTALARAGFALVLLVGLVASGRQLLAREQLGAELRPFWVRGVYLPMLEALPEGARDVVLFTDFAPEAHHVRRFALQFDAVPRVVLDTQDPALAARRLREGLPVIVEFTAPDPERLAELARVGGAVVAARGGPRLALLLPAEAR